ncbi:MAG: hypothetical protein JWM21_1940 [Acidobacteria bacterium]|nr:hypothetical protein [Acidobacteriota bacterium]
MPWHGRTARGLSEVTLFKGTLHLARRTRAGRPCHNNPQFTFCRRDGCAVLRVAAETASIDQASVLSAGVRRSFAESR